MAQKFKLHPYILMTALFEHVLCNYVYFMVMLFIGTFHHHVVCTALDITLVDEWRSESILSISCVVLLKVICSLYAQSRMKCRPNATAQIVELLLTFQVPVF